MDQSGEPEQAEQNVEAPRGMYTAKLDERGRLKISSDFLPWFEAHKGEKLFVTSLDRKIAQIYPLKVWRENERWLRSPGTDQRVARLIAFNAADLGGDAELDNQGRILMPQELRKELGIENQAVVRLYAYKKRIEVMSERVYQERRLEAATNLKQEDIAKAEDSGLQ
jgi:MraZ protein